ncbi:MAG: carboxypeptidase regulatory-like domain-containing protein, partial [Rhodospirillaceae bacterium]|nr:carboxypeptidase regulatory-like domain-containing protein [Rhodospirillaceae bacterium]
MRNSKTLRRCMMAAFALLVLPISVLAAQLPGYGQLSGSVSGSEPGVLPVVYAYNTDKDVGYTVFVVNGKYRAVNLIPGEYDITIRPAVEQLEGFTSQSEQRTVAADQSVSVDFAIKDIGLVPNYIGGYPAEKCDRDYSDCGAEIVSYDEAYPPGPGRDVMERTCLGCHHVQFFPYNQVRGYPGGRAPQDKDTWAMTVDRMHQRVEGAPAGKASYFK